MTTFVKIEILKNGDGAVQFRTNQRVVLAEEILTAAELKSAIQLAIGTAMPASFHSDELFINNELIETNSVDLTGNKKITYKVNVVEPLKTNVVISDKLKEKFAGFMSTENKNLN